MGLYNHVFRDMHKFPLDAPRMAAIAAWDRAGNRTLDTFYLAFVPGGPTLERASVSFINPRHNPAIISESDLTIVCRVDNYAGQPVVAEAELNGEQQVMTRAITGGQDTISWQVRLLEGSNLFNVIIRADDGNRITVQPLTLVYVPGAVDTMPPYIWRVRIGNEIVSENSPVYVSSDRADIEIVVFDEGRGVDSVLVNSSIASNLLMGHIWKLSGFSLKHPFDSLTIRAVDRANNFIEQTIHIIRNSIPRLESGWQWPGRFAAGKVYSDTIRVQDHDRDTVSLVLADGMPESMELLKISADQWVLSWAPTELDTGFSAVTVRLSDRYQDTVMLWTFWTTSTQTARVQFASRESDFPSILETGDTLDFTLRLYQSGLAPCLFTTRMIHPVQQMLYQSADSVLTWTPQMSDTGRVQLFITVTDSRGDADTLYPSIRVVPRNSSPCSLSFSFSGMLSQGMFDMRTVTHAETILFVIHDDDHYLTESYTVGIARSGTRSVQILDTSKQFVIILQPGSGQPRDTLLVSVNDRTGTADSVQIIVLRSIGTVRVAGLNTWLDADTLVTTVSGGVSKWGDLSQSNFELYADSPNYPDLKPNALNGYSAMYFNGDDDNFHSATGTVNDWSTRPFTVFFVARLDEIKAGRRYTLLSSGANNGIDLGVTCSGKLGLFMEESFDGCYNDSRTASSSLTVAAGIWYIITYQSSGFSNGSLETSIWRDGQKASTTVRVSGGQMGTAMLLGAGEMGRWSGAWKGHIAEFVHYDRALSNSERSQVEQILAEKYGLTVAVGQ